MHILKCRDQSPPQTSYKQHGIGPRWLQRQVIYWGSYLLVTFYMRVKITRLSSTFNCKYLGCINPVRCTEYSGVGVMDLSWQSLFANECCFAVQSSNLKKTLPSLINAINVSMFYIGSFGFVLFFIYSSSLQIDLRPEEKSKLFTLNHFNIKIIIVSNNYACNSKRSLLK